MKSLIVFNKVSKSFVHGKTRQNVLNNISLDFPSKGLFFLVGKSGCGKSTVLNLIAQIEKPTSGKIYVLGRDISKISAREKRCFYQKHLGIIFQQYNVFSELTVYENLSISLKMQGKNKEYINKKLKKLIDEFNLSHILNTNIDKISGGEKQRVALVRSISIDPQIILADEPSGALDEDNAEIVFNYLKEQSLERLVIVVTHNINLAKKYSNEIIDLGNKITSAHIRKKTSISKKKRIRQTAYNNYNWCYSFIKFNILNNKVKNALSSFAILIGIVSSILCFGFINGSTNSIDESVKQSLTYPFSRVSSKTELPLGNNNYITKYERPTFNNVNQVFSSIESIVVDIDFSYFIPRMINISYGNSMFNNIQFIPVYNFKVLNNDIVETKYNSLLDNTNSIIVNEEFLELLHINSDNPYVDLYFETSKEFYVEEPFNKEAISERFVYNCDLRIVGVAQEFTYMNGPKIYFSYTSYKDLFKNTYLTNILLYSDKKISYYDYMLNSRNDSVQSSYCLNAFVNNYDEVEKYNEFIDQLNNDSDLEITSESYYISSSYVSMMESFSTIFIFYLVICMAAIVCICAISSFSTFISNKKTSAILTILGASKSEVAIIYFVESLLSSLCAGIFAIPVAEILKSVINHNFQVNLGVKNIVSVPYDEFFNINFFIPLCILFIIFIIPYLSTYIPITLYKWKFISEELKDE